jgi:iron complex outermembrane recepter protein
VSKQRVREGDGVAIRPILIVFIGMLYFWAAKGVAGDLSQTIDFDIPAQSMATALIAYSQQAKIPITVDQRLIENIRSSAVEGTFPADRALKMLLEGSGLTFQEVGKGTLAIHPISGSSDRSGTAAGKPVTLAQEEPRAAPSSEGLDEIVVTATRAGNRDVQSIPEAISVVSPETMDHLGMTGVDDLSRLVPGLSQQQNSPGESRVDIRGIVTTGIDTTNVQDRSLVAIYYDDTPITLNSSNPDLKVFDLERVEVLKGPQGTLYGAGAMAGTIRMITKQPDLTTFSAKIETTVSDTAAGFGGVNDTVRVMVNAPIIPDIFAIRAVGYQEYDTGFIKNVFTTLPDGQESGTGSKNDYRTQQLRIAAKFTPAEHLRFDASYTYEHMLAGRDAGYSGLSPYEFTSLEDPYIGDNFQLFNLTEHYDWDGLQLSNSSSYLNRDFATITSNDLNDPTEGIPTVEPGVSIRNNRVRDFIDELRVTGSAPDLKYTAGVFFEQFKRYFFQDEPSTGLDALYAVDNFYGVPLPGYNSVWDGAFHSNDDFSGLQNINEHQLAVYAEATYTILTRLDMTAGVRYFDWHQAFNLYYGGSFGCNPCTGETNPATGALYTRGTPLAESGDANASGFNPRYSLAYHLSDETLAYVEAAKGFRYGGVNQPVPLSICVTGPGNLNSFGLDRAPISFGPDKLWQYSIGEKSTLLNNRLRLNADAFLIDWTDVQTEQELACSYYYSVNKGDVRSKGVELEATAKLTPQLTVDVSGAYTNAFANGNIPTIGALNGESVPYFPKIQASLSLSYAIPLASDRELSFDGNFNYKSVAYSTFNPSAYDYYELPSSTQMNLGATYHVGRYEFGVYGTNITDGTKIVSYSYTLPSTVGFQPGDQVIYARPRTFGVRAAASF